MVFRIKFLRVLIMFFRFMFNEQGLKVTDFSMGQCNKANKDKKKYYSPFFNKMLAVSIYIITINNPQAINK